MISNADDLEVIHNHTAQRFEIHLGDEMARLDYILSDDSILFTHTEVPPAYEGRGVGNRLVRVAMDVARDQGYTVQTHCSFVAYFIKRHPEYHPISWGYGVSG